MKLDFIFYIKTTVRIRSCLLIKKMTLINNCKIFEIYSFVRNIVCKMVSCKVNKFFINFCKSRKLNEFSFYTFFAI